MATKYADLMIDQRIEWSQVEALLLEVSGGVPFSMGWAARVVGVDERNLARFKQSGAPARHVQALLDRVNRGVHYDVDNPPDHGEISFPPGVPPVDRVPFERVEPLIRAHIGGPYTVEEACALFGITRSTWYDWRKRKKSGRPPGVPVPAIIGVLGLQEWEAAAL